MAVRALSQLLSLDIQLVVQHVVAVEDVATGKGDAVQKMRYPHTVIDLHLVVGYFVQREPQWGSLVRFDLCAGVFPLQMVRERLYLLNLI